MLTCTAFQVPTAIIGPTAFLFLLDHLAGNIANDEFCVGFGALLLLLLISLTMLFRPRTYITSDEGLVLSSWKGRRFTPWRSIESLTYYPTAPAIASDYDTSEIVLRAPGRVVVDLSNFSFHDDKALTSLMVERAGLQTHSQKKHVLVQSLARTAIKGSGG